MKKTISETKAFTSFREGVLTLMDRAERIENILVPGMPDSNICLDGHEFWMEVKAPVEPKRSGTPLFGSNHKVSQDQKNWFLAQRNAGGNAFLYIETNARRILLPSSIVDEVNTMTVYDIIEASLFDSIRPMRKERWGDLRRIIIENCK